MTDRSKMAAWAVLALIALTVWAAVNRYELTPTSVPVYRLDHWTGEVEWIHLAEMQKVARPETEFEREVREAQEDELLRAQERDELLRSQEKRE